MPRRYLLAAGIQNYQSDAWAALDLVPTELRLVTDVLTGSGFALERILEAECQHPKHDELLSALAEWASSPKRKRDDHLVIYWTGHGTVQNERLYLVLPETKIVAVDALDVERMVDALLGEGSRAGPVLLLLDVCFAGQAALNIGARLAPLTRSRPRGRPPEISAICATWARDTAEQLKFAPAFRKALLSCVDPDKRLPPSLNIIDITSKLKTLLGSEQPLYLQISSTGSLDFFPNPHHAAHWPPDIDPATQRLMATLDPAARGVAAPEEAGWFFTGRKRVFADLCEWLAPERTAGLCLVKGGPGAGKSAVLGRLYTLSRTDYRNNIASRSDVLAETEITAPGSIDGAVVLAKRTLREAIADIAQAVRANADTQEQLVTELARRRRTVLVIDGLDEAEAPRNTLQMLEALSGQAPVVIIVGVRSPGVPGEREPDREIDLDAPRWADRGAVETYVMKRLRAARHAVSLGALSDADLEQAAHMVAERSDANFLLATLITTDLVAGTAAFLAGEGWDFPTSVGEAFNRLLDKLGDAEPDARDLLLALSYAEGSGFPKGMLWNRIAQSLSTRPNASPNFVDLFQKSPWFLTENLDREGSVYRVFHAALAEHLQRDRDPTRDHQAIAAVSQQVVAGPELDADVGEIGYARRSLCKHLRRARAWQVLGRLITNPAWIKLQSGSRPFQWVDYAADLEEAQAAARVANLTALARGLSAPALAASVWRVFWRSEVVTQATAVPPSGWAALVRYGRVTPEAALRSVTLIGDDKLRSARLAALARELTGAPLQDLLDTAEGVGTKDCVPIVQFEEILREALAGPDASKVVPRAFAAATRMDDYGRWMVLERLLPHLDAAGLAAVPSLLASMRQTGFLALWGARAFAAYVAACVRNGDEMAVSTLMDKPSNELSWWLGTAAIFRARNPRSGALARRSVTAELARARTAINDFWTRLDVEAALVAGLPNLRGRAHRTALARFLRDLRACRNFDKQARCAVAAASDFPQPHGLRMLLWAKHRLRLAQRTDPANVNWFHTPPALARSLARQGALEEAIDAVFLTQAHPYWQPKALSDLIRSFADGGRGHFKGVGRRILKQASDTADQLQLLSSCIDWLGGADRAKALSSLEQHRFGLARESLAVRGHICAALCRFAGPSEIDSLVQSLFSLADSLPNRTANELLVECAVNCASAGHGNAARGALDRIADADLFPDWAWARVLKNASDASLADLLHGLADIKLLSALLQNMTASDALVSALRRAPAGVINVLESAIQSRSLGWFDTGGALAALAVRAFELGNAAYAARLVPHFGNRLLPLLEAARLPLAERREFIPLLSPATEALPASGGPALEQALAVLLSAGEEDVGEASVRFIEAALAPDVLGIAEAIGPTVIGFIASPARERFVNALVDHQFLAEPLAGSFGPGLDWMLPYLGEGALRRLIAVASKFHDDNYRDQALVRLLPRFADLLELSASLALRKGVERSDFKARSWAAIWPHLSESQRADTLATMTPENPYRSDQQAEALGGIAPQLTSPQLGHIVRWTVRSHGRDQPGLIRPFIAASLQRPSVEAYEVLEALLDEAGYLPGAKAMQVLVETVPLLARLGGRRGLADVDRAIVKATKQWP